MLFRIEHIGEMNVLNTTRFGRCLLVATIICTGCASTPQEMDGMADAHGNVVFSLEDGMQIGDGSQSVHLASGNYRVVKQNAYGSMIAAPAFGVIRSSSRGFLGFQGGVWMPRDRRANAKIYVLHDTSERLYPDLKSALTVPADAERKMLEIENKSTGLNDSALVAGADKPRSFEYGNPAYSPALIVVMAVLESQRGKPDVVAEIPQDKFEELLALSMRK